LRALATEAERAECALSREDVIEAIGTGDSAVPSTSDGRGAPALGLALRDLLVAAWG
jgi:hypothetical protein